MKAAAQLLVQSRESPEETTVFYSNFELMLLLLIDNRNMAAVNLLGSQVKTLFLKMMHWLLKRN